MQYALVYPSWKFFSVHGIQALALLAIGVTSFQSIRRGRWAIPGAVGGILGGAVALLLALGWAEYEFAESSGVFDLIPSGRAEITD